MRVIPSPCGIAMHEPQLDGPQAESFRSVVKQYDTHPPATPTCNSGTWRHVIPHPRPPRSLCARRRASQTAAVARRHGISIEVSPFETRDNSIPWHPRPASAAAARSAADHPPRVASDPPRIASKDRWRHMLLVPGLCHRVGVRVTPGRGARSARRPVEARQVRKQGFP